MPTTRSRRRLLAALLLASLGCAAGPTGPDASVSVRAVAGGIEFANRGQAPIFYFAYSRAAMAYTDFPGGPPCTSATPGCPTVRAGQTIVRPWSELGGKPEDREFLVSWWGETSDGNGGTVATATHQLTITR